MLAYAYKNNVIEDLSLKTELNSTLSSSSKSKYPKIPYHTIPCFPLCFQSYIFLLNIYGMKETLKKSAAWLRWVPEVFSRVRLGA